MNINRGSCKTSKVDTEVDPPANKQAYFVGSRRGRLRPALMNGRFCKSLNRLRGRPFAWRGMLGALLLTGLAIQAQGQRIPVDGLAAKVNNRAITVGEVMAAVQPMERRLRMTYTGQELVQRLEEAFEQTLNAMMEQALIIEEFKRRDGQMPRQAVDQQIQAIIAENFGGDRGRFLQQLADEGMTLEEWREEIRDQMIVMMLRSEEVRPKVVVSPRQIRAAYEARLAEFQQDAEARVRMITLTAPSDDHEQEDPVSVDPEVQAENLRTRVLDGESFAELARTYSQDPRAERGGDWGWIDPEVLRPELAQVAAHLEAGAVSEVITTPEAAYLLTVEDRREARIIPFSEVRDELADDVRREEEARIYRAWIDRLRARHHVERFDLDDRERSL